MPLLGIICGAHLASGATLQVDAKQEGTPYRTIQSALDAAKPGDTIRVAPGVYQERLRFKTGGTPEQPIILEGQEGAILDGSTPVKLDWQLDESIAPGVYRAPVDFFPYTVTADGKMITTIDERRTDPATEHPPRDNLRWPAIFKGGAGEAGWSGLRAAAMYRTKEKDLLIKFRKNLDPRGMTITVSPKAPAILISGGLGNIVIRGLTIRNATYGVRLEGAKNVTVENCHISPVDYAIHMEAKTSNCVIRNNEMAMMPYSGADPWRAGSWDNWQAHKNAGFYDRYAVRASETKDCEISGNFIHDHWDGVQTGWPGAPGDNGGMNIHGNVFYNIFDDAMETSGGQANNRWHSNFVERARIGIRIKNPDQGPLYIYRNLFMGNKSDMVIWSSGKSYNPAQVWVYHNTCTSDVSLGTNFSQGIAATENYHVLNNIFWCMSTLRREPSYPLPNWKSDNNVFVAVTLENPRPWVAESDGFDAANRKEKWERSQEQSRQAGIEKASVWAAAGDPGFTDAASRDLRLNETSPAFAAGQDLSKNQPALPGCEPGYFQGAKPNAGALQKGEAMPALPVQVMGPLKPPQAVAAATPAP